jgi:hypothetical protein
MGESMHGRLVKAWYHMKRFGVTRFVLAGLGRQGAASLGVT